jgi:hypothetical protein
MVAGMRKMLIESVVDEDDIRTDELPAIDARMALPEDLPNELVAPV